MSAGQIVTPPQGIVQREPVLTFVMGTHERLGGDSPVHSLCNEVFRLILSSAGIWRELGYGVLIRCEWPSDTAGFYITNGEVSDDRYDYLIRDMGSLTRTRTAMLPEDYFTVFGVTVTISTPTWTESEIL